MIEAIEALALVSGRVEQELLIRNEYLAAKNSMIPFTESHMADLQSTQDLNNSSSA